MSLNNAIQFMHSVAELTPSETKTLLLKLSNERSDVIRTAITADKKLSQVGPLLRLLQLAHFITVSVIGQFLHL